MDKRASFSDTFLFSNWCFNVIYKEAVFKISIDINLEVRQIYYTKLQSLAVVEEVEIYSRILSCKSIICKLLAIPQLLYMNVIEISTVNRPAFVNFKSLNFYLF
jgi:hypothetical protein